MTIINPVKSYQIHTILDIGSALWCAQNIAQYFKRSILVLFLVLLSSGVRDYHHLKIFLNLSIFINLILSNLKSISCCHFATLKRNVLFKNMEEGL